MAVDNSMSLLPGSNPTGGPIKVNEGFVPGAGTSSGANPMLLPPNLPASAPPSNPYSTSVVPPPAFPANAGPYGVTSLASSGPGGTNPITNLGTTRQQGRSLGELQSMYGEGLGAALYQFLQGGAGFNQNAINNLFAALQPGIERGTENLMEQFSASGNRFGSGAQIGLGDYLSQVQLNEGQLETQMYEQSVQDYMNTLLGTSSQNLQYKESQPSTWDKISGILGIGTSLLGGGSGGLLGGIGNIISKLSGGGGSTYDPTFTGALPGLPNPNDPATWGVGGGGGGGGI